MQNFTFETKLKDLDLSIRSTNGLYREGYETLGDILNLDQFSLQKIRNLGRKSIKEILDLIETFRYNISYEEYQKSEFSHKFALFGVSTKEEKQLVEAGINTIFDFADFGKWPVIKSIVAKDIETHLKRISECKTIYPFDMETNILQLNLSVRSKNCLRREGLTTIQDLIDVVDSDLSNIENLGVKSKQEILDYKNIVLVMIASDKEYSENVNIDFNLLGQISNWSNLNFLNITEHLSSTFEYETIADIISIYNHVSKNGEQYNNELKRNLIFILQSLEEIVQILKNSLDDYIQNEIRTLKISERDIDILSKRHFKTLEEIASDYNISRERVRQIVEKKSGIINKWFKNSFLSNVILINNMDHYLDDKLLLAIYYSAYGNNSIVYKNNSIKRYYSATVVNEYKNLVSQVSKAIDNGFQPEVNQVFHKFLSDKFNYENSEKVIDFSLINICQFTTEELNHLDQLIEKLSANNQEEFVSNMTDKILSIIRQKISSDFEFKNEYLKFIYSEIDSFLHSIYNLIHSSWMFKFSDRLLDVTHGISRKYSFILFNDGFLLSNNSIKSAIPSNLDLMLNDFESPVYHRLFTDIFHYKKSIDYFLLESILIEQGFTINKTSITMKNTIVSICISFMKRYRTVVDTRSEEMITQLSYYFNEYNRYIYRSRNIINSLLESSDIDNLDTSRFIISSNTPPLVEDYCERIKFETVINPEMFFFEYSENFRKSYLYNFDTIILVIEYICDDSLLDFGNSRYLFSKKSFCTPDDKKIIQSELKLIIQKYKNPSYKSIFEKLDENTLIYSVLQKYKIISVDEFIDFINYLDFDDVEIFDKSKSSRLGSEKTKELKRRLDSYIDGFTFENLLTILEDYGNHAVNIKYVYLDNYYQIDKEKFISKRHIKRSDITEIIDIVNILDSDYITLNDLKAILPIWINPYFAMSVIKHTNSNYSPIEQHGLIQIHNPILSHRRTSIYSLYNLIYQVLSEEYRGSLLISAVIKHLKKRGIIIQKELPKYFFELGFGEIENGTLILKGKSQKISNQNEIFSIIDDFFE